MGGAGTAVLGASRYGYCDAVKGEKPRRFERLCYRALVEGAVSDTRAAELLGISVHELNRRVEAPPDLEVVPV